VPGRWAWGCGCASEWRWLAFEQLALRTLSSPIDGVAVDRLLNTGDLAGSGSGRRAVLKLAKIDPLRVDAASGTVVARLELRNKDGRIASGVRCTADLHPPRAPPGALAPRP